MGKNIIAIVIMIVCLYPLSNIFADNLQSGESVEIDIPNSTGGFTPVRLTKHGDGYTGPQGEYYAGNPTIQQLEVLYGNTPSASIPSSDEQRVSYFHESLSPYGEWVWNQVYGWVWSPYDVPVDWRPYTDGHWVYTDYGWTWVSDRYWGWACFHYGRWFYDDYYGWLWYPDTIWAPAWVVWRTGGDFIGWAPLPPRAVWRAGIGFESADFYAGIQWYSYSFCCVREFTDNDISRHIEIHSRNVTIIKTTNIVNNNMTIVNDHVVNEVPFHAKIVKAAGHPIQRLTIAAAQSPEQHGVAGNQLRVFRPEISAKPAQIAASSPKPKPAEAKIKHALEIKDLEKIHTDRRLLLEAQHAQEIKNPPAGVTKEQLLQQHKAEFAAQQEQMNRERQLLQNQRAREAKTAMTPKITSQQHIAVPAPQAESNRTDRAEDKHGEGQPNSE